MRKQQLMDAVAETWVIKFDPTGPKAPKGPRKTAAKTPYTGTVVRRCSARLAAKKQQQQQDGLPRSKRVPEVPEVPQVPYKITVDVAEDVGFRNYMEDVHLVEEVGPYTLYMVCDGHGGKEAARYFKQHFPLHLSHHLIDLGDEPQRSLTHAFRDIHGAWDKDAGEDDSGSTVCGLLFQRDSRNAWVFNLGDSRLVAYQCTSVAFKSRDHDFDDPEIDKIIEARGSACYVSRGSWYGVPRLNGQLAVASAFGDNHMGKCMGKEPDITPLDLAHQGIHTIVIGSDGLWDEFDEKEVIDLVVWNFSAAKIVHRAKNNGRAGDNITAMVLSVLSQTSAQ